MASRILCSIIAVAYCIFLTSCASLPPAQHAYPVVVHALSAEILYVHPMIDLKNSKELQHLEQSLKLHMVDGVDCLARASMSGRSVLLSSDSGANNVAIHLDDMASIVLPSGYIRYEIGPDFWLMSSADRTLRVVNTRSGRAFPLPFGTMAASYRDDGALLLLSTHKVIVANIKGDTLHETSRFDLPDFQSMTGIHGASIVSGRSLTRAIVTGRWGENAQPGDRLIDLETGQISTIPMSFEIVSTGVNVSTNGNERALHVIGRFRNHPRSVYSLSDDEPDTENWKMLFALHGLSNDESIDSWVTDNPWILTSRSGLFDYFTNKLPMRHLVNRENPRQRQRLDRSPSILLYLTPDE